MTLSSVRFGSLIFASSTSSASLVNKNSSCSCAWLFGDRKNLGKSTRNVRLSKVGGSMWAILIFAMILVISQLRTYIVFMCQKTRMFLDFGTGVLIEASSVSL